MCILFCCFPDKSIHCRIFEKYRKLQEKLTTTVISFWFISFYSVSYFFFFSKLESCVEYGFFHVKINDVKKFTI